MTDEWQMLEVDDWATNSDLIRDTFRLFVWKRWSMPRIVDVTWGRGKWWTWLDIEHPDGTTTAHWEAANFTRHGLDVAGKGKEFDDGVDFRALPEDDRSFDVVAFDPDYVSMGGRDTIGESVRDMAARYGMDTSEASPAEVQAAINAGLTECYRVLDGQGLALVKCSNYVSSAKLVLGEYETIKAALAVGFRIEARIIHRGHPGPQPPGRAHVHPRSNSSTLLVCRRPGRARRRAS